jgi:hypothetical protein
LICAILINKSARCWGLPRWQGNLTPLNSLTAFEGLNNVVHLALNSSTICGLFEDRSVKCFGDLNGNINVSIQTGGPVYSNKLVTATGLGNEVVSIKAGPKNICATNISGGVKCWGYSTYNEIPRYGLVNGFVPTPGGAYAEFMPNWNSNVIGLSIGYEFICASLVDGTVQCRGSNSIGQVGFGKIGENSTYQQLATVSGISKGTTNISSGQSSTCALVLNQVQCWGLLYSASATTLNGKN